MAIDRMGKNKAAAADELLDTIFQVNEWKLLQKKLLKEKQERKGWKEEVYDNKKDLGKERDSPLKHASEFVNHIKYVLAKNLTEYLQYMINEKMELPCKQNLLE